MCSNLYFLIHHVWASFAIDDELLAVIWAYYTMVQASAEETPYKLVFESDAVIPIEVAKPNSRIVSIDKGSNDEIWKVKLDLIEKEREIARVKEEVMKLQIARKYNRHVSLKSFKERDVVLRQIELQRKVVGKGKLTSN